MIVSHNDLFDGSSMLELYKRMQIWQKKNNKRFLSTDIVKDGDVFCCIALTNPREVVITSADGGNHAYVCSKKLLRVRDTPLSIFE